MIVCPLCEHQQAQGAECDACGRVLVAAAPVAVVVQPLPELDGSAFEARAAAAAAPVQPMAELELNRLLAGPDVPSEPVADLEPGRSAPVGELHVEPLPELDLARVQDADPRTVVASGPIACRYCRSVQATGLFCDRCGMRLPRPKAGGAAAAQQKSGGADWTRCKSCGAPAKAGHACGDCGRDVPFPES